MERDTQVVAKTLQVGGIRLVVDVFHADVESFNFETWLEDLLTTGEKFR